MPLPARAVILIVGSAATGATGLVVGTVGGVQMKRAHGQIKAQAARYSDRHVVHQANNEETNVALLSLGETQEAALHQVIFRMRDFLERHAKQVKANEHLILDGVDSSQNPVVGLTKLAPDVAGWVQGVVSSTIVGVATPVVLKTAVTQFAVASTGTAISTLSGVAATNATLAWFGGGSIAAGGGGMALGATVLNITVAGPTLLVAGFTVKNRGTKARTEAESHRAEVEVLIAKLDVRDEQLRGIRDRTSEVDETLKRLMVTATNALDLLESESFSMEFHAERLQRALILVKSVRDVATAPITDEDGHLDEGVDQLIVKYRDQREKING